MHRFPLYTTWIFLQYNAIQENCLQNLQLQVFIWNLLLYHCNYGKRVSKVKVLSRKSVNYRLVKRLQYSVCLVVLRAICKVVTKALEAIFTLGEGASVVQLAAIQCVASPASRDSSHFTVHTSGFPHRLERIYIYKWMRETEKSPSLLPNYSLHTIFNYTTVIRTGITCHSAHHQYGLAGYQTHRLLTRNGRQLYQHIAPIYGMPQSEEAVSTIYIPLLVK